MRNIYTYILIFMSAVSSCGAFTQSERPVAGTVKVVPRTFAEVGDSLKIEFDIYVKTDAINRRQSWTVSPVLCSGDSVTVFPYALINGRQNSRLFYRQTVFGNTELAANYPAYLAAATNGRDTVIRYSVTRPYELWIDTARLEVKQELISPAGKKQLFVTEGFGAVELMARSPYMVEPLVNYLIPEREDKQRRVQGQAYLDFQAGRSVILPQYRRNPEELAQIAEVFTKVMNDEDVQITAVFVEGYASPEGSYALNERLSRERAEALRQYLSQAFSLDGSMFRVNSVAEDWDGLRLLVEESNIPQKERIYAIIDSEDDYDRKEQRLRALGGPWRTMLNELFPQLRRVEYRIDFAVKDYTVEESRDLARHNPEMLSQRELFVLAQSYAVGSTERDQMLDLIFRQYPDDITATVNSAAGMLQRGEDATAKRYLDRVADNPEAWNNLGVYWLRAGELDRAQEYFEKAKAEGVAEAEHNLREVERKREDNEVMQRYNR